MPKRRHNWQKLNRDLTRTGGTAPVGFSFGYHLSRDPSGSIYAKSSCDVGSHDIQIRELESSVARRRMENAKT
ncbi:hypothetical protein BOTBODRAFT_69787 [Botryobasidium botryosum FD-172 SS1]|uniref:Uncharacterized protein n=1 Tax=Botryobasidium botryosum (strain FD-172 SS1) TaxID=930990 RepID=A0A067M9F8_BOTB1|nr:hypothetical protein BOTBODRAFT_69787 [Botryobasidium botryosum FD-172 SS1]